MGLDIWDLDFKSVRELQCSQPTNIPAPAETVAIVAEADIVEVRTAVSKLCADFNVAGRPRLLPNQSLN